jgi:hypothetical protein
MKGPATTILGATAALTLSLTLAAAAERRPPYVLELFTSQGCNSCPPANANLIRLRDRPDVLALSFSVTYWDGLGWKDIFGKPEFTRRQEVYEGPLGHPGPFTPQMVVNGGRDAVGADISEIEPLLAGQRLGEAPLVNLSASSINVGPGAAPQGGADVWLVRYDPRIVEVPVTRGENAGHTLPHANVVREFARLGRWDGNQTAYPLSRGDAGLKTAVLLQAPDGGRILSAVTD